MASGSKVSMTDCVTLTFLCAWKAIVVDRESVLNPFSAKRILLAVSNLKDGIEYDVKNLRAEKGEGERLRSSGHSLSHFTYYIFFYRRMSTIQLFTCSARRWKRICENLHD